MTDYFENLRKGGPSYDVRNHSATAFGVYCRDQDSNDKVLEFQKVAQQAKAHEDGDWEVKLGPPRGFTQRSIPGWAGRVYLMASITKVTG